MTRSPGWCAASRRPHERHGATGEHPPEPRSRRTDPGAEPRSPRRRRAGRSPWWSHSSSSARDPAGGRCVSRRRRRRRSAPRPVNRSCRRQRAGRCAPRLPEVSELELLRHFNRLSHLNHAIDLGFYPLGSCTMKYNPKVNEWAAGLPGFAGSHPLDPAAMSQGSLELQWLLAELLREVSGMAAVSLQPAAGAHGELTGMLMTRAYHRARGEGEQRTRGAGARTARTARTRRRPRWSATRRSPSPRTRGAGST